MGLLKVERCKLDEIVSKKPKFAGRGPWLFLWDGSNGLFWSENDEGLDFWRNFSVAGELKIFTNKNFNFWAQSHCLETSESHIFFSTPQNLTKKIPHEGHDVLYMWWKFQMFWNTSKQSDSSISTKYPCPNKFHQSSQRCHSLRNCASLLIFFS